MSISSKSGIGDGCKLAFVSFSKILKDFRKARDVQDLPDVEVRGSEHSNDACHSHDSCTAPSIHCKVRNGQCFVCRHVKTPQSIPGRRYVQQ
jgi:hypothetical protein